MSTRYRKKPVVIDATQWDGTADAATTIIDWILGNGGTATYECADPDRCGLNDGDSPHRIRIQTLEGPITASVGDWIVKGVREEFYPVKPKIFADTYEPVEAE